MEVVLSQHARAKMVRRQITSAQVTQALSVKPVPTSQDGGGYLSQKTLAGETFPLLVVWTRADDKIVVKTAYWKGKPEPTTTPIWNGIVETRHPQRRALVRQLQPA
jgi:hypothetical protein